MKYPHQRDCACRVAVEFVQNLQEEVRPHAAHAGCRHLELKFCQFCTCTTCACKLFVARPLALTNTRDDAITNCQQKQVRSFTNRFSRFNTRGSYGSGKRPGVRSEVADRIFVVFLVFRAYHFPKSPILFFFMVAKNLMRMIINNEISLIIIFRYY